MNDFLKFYIQIIFQFTLPIQKITFHSQSDSDYIPNWIQYHITLMEKNKNIQYLKKCHLILSPFGKCSKLRYHFTFNEKSIEISKKIQFQYIKNRFRFEMKSYFAFDVSSEFSMKVVNSSFWMIWDHSCTFSVEKKITKLYDFCG